MRKIFLGVIFALIIIFNFVAVIFLIRYERSVGNATMELLVKACFVVSGGYSLGFSFYKLWKDDIESLKRIDLPTVILATIPVIILSFGIWVKGETFNIIPVLILWGIISLLELFTAGQRFWKNNNRWNIWENVIQRK